MGQKSVGEYLERIKCQIRVTENNIIFFNDDDEIDVVTTVINEVTNNFVILHYLGTISLVYGKTKFMKYDRVTGIRSADASEMTRYRRCIYYVRIPNGENNGENELNAFITQHILKNVMQYQYLDIRVVGENAIPIFTKDDNDNYNIGNDAIYLNLIYGIGDFFILGSVYIEAIRRMKASGHKVYLTFGDRLNLNAFNLYDAFFKKDCERLVFSNSLYLDGFLSQVGKVNSKRVINLQRIFAGDGRKRHVLLMAQDILLNGDRINPYIHFDYIQEQILNNISDCERAYIDKTIDGMSVSFQFYTGRIRLDGTWRDSDPRCWDIDNVAEFIELCRDNNIKVFSITPHPYGNIEGMSYLSNLSMFGYIYALSKMKYHIGIDSSAGHIAAFYNIPNITLWHRNLGLSNSIDCGMYVGFRTLRKNISVVSKTGNMVDIKANYIINTLKSVMDSRYDLSDIEDINCECTMFEKSVIHV